MKAYILKEEDFVWLLAEIDKSPSQAYSGRTLTQAESVLFQQAHRFYNYIIHKWMDRVKR